MEEKHNFTILALVAIVAVVGLTILSQNKATVPDASFDEAANIGGEGFRIRTSDRCTCLEYETVIIGEAYEVDTKQIKSSTCDPYGDNKDPFAIGGIYVKTDKSSDGSEIPDECLASITLSSTYLAEAWCGGPVFDSSAFITTYECSEGCEKGKCKQITTSICIKWSKYCIVI